jgi:hypothetical protein
VTLTNYIKKWDYVAPTNNDWRQNSDDLQQKVIIINLLLHEKPELIYTFYPFQLRELLERQKYLESVIWSQAEQIKHTSIIPDKDSAINTMRSIFLMSVSVLLIDNTKKNAFSDTIIRV